MGTLDLYGTNDRQNGWMYTYDNIVGQVANGEASDPTMTLPPIPQDIWDMVNATTAGMEPGRGEHLRERMQDFQTLIDEINRVLSDPNTPLDAKQKLLHSVFEGTSDKADGPDQNTMSAVGQMISLLYSGTQDQIKDEWIRRCDDLANLNVIGLPMGFNPSARMITNLRNEITKIDREYGITAPQYGWVGAMTEFNAEGFLDTNRKLAADERKDWSDRLAAAQANHTDAPKLENHQWFQLTPDDIEAFNKVDPGNDNKGRGPLLETVKHIINLANATLSMDLTDDERADFLARFFGDSSDNLQPDKENTDTTASIAGKIVAAVLARDGSMLCAILGKNEIINDGGHNIYMKFASAVSTWKKDNDIQRPDQDPAASAAVDALYEQLKRSQQSDGDLNNMTVAQYMKNHNIPTA